MPSTYEAITGEVIEAQQHNDPLEDLAADANLARPIVAGGTGATTAAGARTNLSVPGTGNKLINALGIINQRGYVSGAAVGAGIYTVDRWRIVTATQSLSWTESANVRTFTAPAGGVEQVIEGTSLVTGSHVLNWTGTATATVGGVSRTKGEVFSLTGGTNTTVRFTSGTFSLPQLEEGTSATTFAPRHPQQELDLCQRYYERTQRFDWLGYQQASAGVRHAIQWRTPKRTVPTITKVFETSANMDAAAATFSEESIYGLMATRLKNGSAGLYQLVLELVGSAEL